MFSEILYETNSAGINLPLSRFISEAMNENKHPTETEFKENTFITIIACHTESLDRVKTIVNNIRRIAFPGNKIVVVNSINSRFNRLLSDILTTDFKDVEFLCIPNTNTLDIGKCMFYLKKYYKPIYEHIVLTNDSYYLTGSIYNYYRYMTKSPAKLYGFNDSFQDRYHYQSYLYSIRKDSMNILIRHYEAKKHLLTGYMEVVRNVELKLCDIFSSRDCYLKIANLPGHKGRNIFFNNDKLYNILMKRGILPIIKIKRIKDPSSYQPHIPTPSVIVQGMLLTQVTNNK